MTNNQELADRIKSEEFQGVSRQQPIPVFQQEDQTFSKSQFQNQDNTEPRGIMQMINFTFKNVTSYLTEEIITKRIILSSIAKIFDPLGLLSSVFVAFKILFQDICKKEVDWDTPPGGEILKQWRSFCKTCKTFQVSQSTDATHLN